jgi:hypothetical protein
MLSYLLVGDMVMRGYVLEVPTMCKISELVANKLPGVVSHYYFWHTICGKYSTTH